MTPSRDFRSKSVGIGDSLEGVGDPPICCAREQRVRTYDSRWVQSVHNRPCTFVIGGGSARESNPPGTTQAAPQRF